MNSLVVYVIYSLLRNLTKKPEKMNLNLVCFQLAEGKAGPSSVHLEAGQLLGPRLLVGPTAIDHVRPLLPENRHMDMAGICEGRW